MSEILFLRPPWKNLARQHQTATFGMWVFLASEVLLFSGLFAGYSVYRVLYQEAFLTAGRQTDIIYGTVNTFILMTSSLTIALAGRMSEAGSFRMGRALLAVTFLLGVFFLILKGLEYAEDIRKHLFPASNFLLSEPGAEFFFSFYWVMTALHATHVTAGLIGIGRLGIASRHDPRWLSGSASMEATALYWHLVDVIWIILYPLLYLAGRAHG